MSHYKQRIEKNCLNCNAQVADRFCGVCGQENIEVKESVFGIIRHFFEDITHYDGKFLSTLKLLLFKPGFLPIEYLRGRRASYLHPIRLYIFTSAFFFLIFFTFYQNKGNDIIKADNNSSLVAYKNNLNKEKIQLEDKLKLEKDSTDLNELQNDLADVIRNLIIIEKDSTKLDSLTAFNNDMSIISLKNSENRKNYETLKQYDSLQNSLPVKDKDGFILSRVERQNLFLKEKYHNNKKEIFDAIGEDFKHRFPQMLFLSLPLFGLLLKLLYLRRKNYSYVSHLIFSIYLYCGFFILILFSLWGKSLLGCVNLHFPKWISILYVIVCFYYFYKSLRFFYQQGRAKTIFKYLVLLFCCIFLSTFIFILFLIFSTFTI